MAFWGLRPRPIAEPDPLRVLERIQAVARLDALEVVLYRKVSFTPDPALTNSLWGDVWAWARHSLRNPHGRAIVFAKAHFLYDLSHVKATQLQVNGAEAAFTLPPVEVVVELLPGETEVIDSTLDSQETAALLELAKKAILQETRSDPALLERARRSAEATLKLLLLDAGYAHPRVSAPAA